MDWIEANGASLRYDLSGRGPETVVLIHEVGGCIESWDEAHAAFRRQFRVLRYDQRGFGLSEKTRVITMDGIVADLAALLDALQISGTVHLAGCAMGAIGAAGLLALLAYSAFRGDFASATFYGGAFGVAALGRLMFAHDALAVEAVALLGLVALAGATAAWRARERGR